jgi:membrane-bound metal-dependent hydrolase YbcI (DUF457 family)
MLSVSLTLSIYPYVVSFLFKLDKKTVKERCYLSRSTLALCLFGSLSHVLIDALHHEYNPLLFPFTYSSYDALVLMSDYKTTSLIIPLSFLSLLILFVAKEAKKGTKNIWKRLLLE